MVKEVAIPSDLTEALARMRDVHTADIDPVELPPQGVVINAGETANSASLPRRLTARNGAGNSPSNGVGYGANGVGYGANGVGYGAGGRGNGSMNGSAVVDEFVDGMDMLDDLDRDEPVADPDESSTRIVYRDYIRELPSNWSSRIVECRNDENPDDADPFEDIGGPDMNGVQHSVKIDTHEVLFLWVAGAELFVFDARDLTLHGEEIESGYTSWEVTPSDFCKFIGGATRYPDRGARSKRMFWRRR